jgi:PAS domain S-box-containing protein
LAISGSGWQNAEINRPWPNDGEVDMDEPDLNVVDPATVLDGLAAEVAVLDLDGVIVEVNDRWQQFGAANGGDPVTCGVGASYLAVCAASDDDDAARDIGQAIRAALRGDLGVAAVVEIPCHSPDGDRWFDVAISSRTNHSGTAIGATVMLTPVTARKQQQLETEQFRDVRELRFRDALAALFATTRQATSLGEVYLAVAEGARAVADADSAVVNLVDDHGETAVTVAASGANAESLAGHRTPIEASMSATIITTGQPRLIKDATADKAVWQPAASIAPIRSVVAAPLSTNHGAFGLVGANTIYGGRVFTDIDLQYLVQYSTFAALSIETAQRLLAPTPQSERSALPPSLPVASVGSLRPLTDLDEVEAWAIVEASPDGMILADEHGTILLVNAQIEELFGYDRGDLLGKTVEELLPDRKRQVHTAHRTRYRAQPRARAMGTGLDLLARRKDGTEFAVEVSLSPIDTGTSVRVVATVRDISSRVAAEAFNHAVQQSIHAARDSVFMFSPDTLKFSYVNDSAVAQLGYSRDELLSMSPLHIKPNFTDIQFRDLLAPMLDGTQTAHVFTTVHRRKDGRDLPVELSLEYPPAAGPGQPRMFVAFARDITERVQADEVIRASEQAFRFAFDEAPVGMATASISSPKDRTITAVNQAFADFLGYTRDELLTRTFASLTHPDDRNLDEEAATELAAGTRTAYTAQKRYLHADGHSAWAWLHSRILTNAEGEPASVLAHIVDIGDQKIAEAERARHASFLAGLAEVRSSVLIGRPLEETLGIVCTSVVKLVDADMAIISAPDHDHDVMRHLAFDSTATQQLVPDAFPIDQPLRNALHGEAFMSSRLADDTRVSEHNRLESGTLDTVTAVMVVPITTDTGTSKLLFVSNQRTGHFTETELETAQRFAAEAATAIALNEARQTETKLRVLEVRERLARDLHDRVIQGLFAAGMGLQSVQTLAAPTVAKRIGDTVEQLDQTIGDLRSAIFGLNTVESSSAADELATIFTNAAQHLGFKPTVTYRGDPDELPGVVLEQLGPTLIEALSNISHHANATAADISLTCTPTTVELAVTDDGDGIDPNAAHGHGLQNVKARAQRLNGTATLTPAHDGGTTLTWTATTARPQRTPSPTPH